MYNLKIMAKEIKQKLTILALAGKATPAPPIGPALGAAGINIGTFIKEFNDATTELQKTYGDIMVPANIIVYEDRSYTFVIGTPPASQLILKAANISKGSSAPNKNKVGKISKNDLLAIAEKKMTDLNTTDINSAIKIISGTAKSLGVEVV